MKTHVHGIHLKKARPYSKTLDYPEKNVLGTNTLAYFGTTSVTTKKKKFCNTDTLPPTTPPRETA